jgi:sigma-B regulation protein RsbU (phosphoserine phosphatase)
VFRGEPIGILQLYTAQPRPFGPDEIALARAVGQILATAIQHARLDAQRQEAQRVQRQLSMAADVQKRMFPRQVPRVEPFDIAARYVPSFELSGDFYDMIDLEGNLGLAVADVAGKGIAASLVMASVRSSLRAFAQDVYDIEQIMARVNIALCRDTLANEFATLFYGVLDPRTRRFTYCNAGHEPPLLLRRGEFTRLEAGGMIVGVDPLQKYDKGLLDLLPGDFLLLYTDGLADALNFDQQRFGRARIMQAMRDAAEKNAADAVNHILWEMRRFAGFNPRSDDTTLVAVKVKG